MTLKLKNINRWLPVLLIILVGILAYANSLGNEMFWDDDDFILKNRFIKEWHFFPQFFTQNLVAGGYLVSNYWRPVLLTVFSIEWHLWKDWVYGWHIVSTAAHIGVGVLLYFLFLRLFNQRTLAIAIALLFIAHPTHNEAVVYVNSLGDSLASIWVLSSLLFYVRFRQDPKPRYFSFNYIASLLCFPLAVMSKETGFILCGLLPWMDFFMFNTSKSVPTRLRRVLVAVWPLFLAALVYIYLRATSLNFANSFNFYKESNEFSTNIGIRLLTFFKAMTQYAGFTFMPYELRVERQLPFAKSLFEWDVLWGGFIVAVLLWLMIRNWKKRPWITFLTGWFFIAIAPASNVLVPINAVLYEHFLYFPIVGIIALMCSLALTYAPSPAQKQSLAKILAIVLIIFISINVRRNTDWKTAIGFYEKLVVYAPSYRVINNLGMEYADRGIHDKALVWYQKAIDMDPKNPVAYHNLGGTLRDTGHLKEAESSFKKAIELDHNFIFSYRSLGELYYRMGDLNTSRQYLQIVYQYDPNDLQAQQALNFIDEQIKAQATK